MSGQENWFEIKERGNLFFLKLTVLIIKYTPLIFIRFCINIVCFYFYLSSKKTRNNIRKYQNRLKEKYPQINLPKYMPIYRQIREFAYAIVDRFMLWQGKFDLNNIEVCVDDGVLLDLSNSKRGKIILCSHFGNNAVSQYLVEKNVDIDLSILIHSKHAGNYRYIEEKLSSGKIKFMQVSELNMDQMMKLSEIIDKGACLAIAADRIPLSGERTVEVEFLSYLAKIPQGAFLLAYLLKADVYTLFVNKNNHKYLIELEKFEMPFNKPKRIENIQSAATNYTQLLEKKLIKYPLQWFNFYDFWR